MTFPAPASASPPTIYYWIPLISVVISGFIGAVVALAAPFVKDVYIQRKNDEKLKRLSQQETFRLYVAPMVDACQKLLWRFSEIFLHDRHQWLMSSTLPLEYNEYKRNSTLYRLAVLLGWIRAISLELNALPRGPAGFRTGVLAAIERVRDALSDGKWVELERLERLCGVWSIPVSGIDDPKKMPSCYTVGSKALRGSRFCREALFA